MDKVSFATLACQLQAALGTTLGHWQLTDIARIVDDAFNDLKDKRAPADDIAMSVQRIITNAIGGRKIEAIKDFRSLTGWGLKESKDAIENSVADGQAMTKW